MYIVNGVSYAHFDEVEAMAWNTLKVMFTHTDEDLSEERKQEACRQLETLMSSTSV